MELSSPAWEPMRMRHTWFCTVDDPGSALISESDAMRPSFSLATQLATARPLLGMGRALTVYES